VIENEIDHNTLSNRHGLHRNRVNHTNDRAKHYIFDYKNVMRFVDFDNRKRRQCVLREGRKLKKLQKIILSNKKCIIIFITESRIAEIFSFFFII